GILKGSVRKGDVVGRYGGEEFFLILPHTNLSQATELSERIRMNIENNRFSNGIHLKVSGGVKQFTGETLTELIDCADQNLYRAKKLGKNKIENSI
ncbi:MAG: GGDEF domain-containing protein, partial [Lachnospiraceae bacterium]|nr:GGDEF domain-containing protein [Lachnospiraceae bacterium]